MLSGIVDDSARGIFTKHMYEEMGRTINIDEGRAFEKGERHRQRSRHGNQIPRRTDTSTLVAETAAQANPVQTAPGLDRDSKQRERRGSADE